MYVLNVMLHESKQLFHVSSHNVNSKNIGCVINASKARYIYNNLCAGVRSNNERGLTAGLAVAFVNTDYVGWTDVMQPKQYNTRLQAATAKVALVACYIKLGYTNVGVRNSVSNNTGGGAGGARWTAKFPLSMNKDTIDTKIGFINTSLQLSIPQHVKSNAYSMLAGTTYAHRNVVKRYGFKPTEIDNLATLLRFVRQAMGLK